MTVCRFHICLFKVSSSIVSCFVTQDCTKGISFSYLRYAYDKYNYRRRHNKHNVVDYKKEKKISTFNWKHFDVTSTILQIYFRLSFELE